MGKGKNSQEALNKKHEHNTRFSSKQNDCSATEEEDVDVDDVFTFQKLSPNTTKDLSNLLKKLKDQENGGTIVKIVNKLNSAIEFLSGQVNSLRKENEKLREGYDELAFINSSLSSRVADAERKIVDAETNAAKLNQYGRRNNLQLDGIPENISDDKLESKVVEILGELRVPITSMEIEACHRLPNKRGEKGPRRTVVRVINRRKCEQAVRNAKKLDDKEIQKRLKVGRVFISEDLCPYYRKLAYMCRCLRRSGKIEHVSSANGSVRILINAGDEKRISIFHESELVRRFPNYNFQQR